MIRGSTNVTGILGDAGHVEMSLSPAIHNAAFSSLGMDWVYVGLPVSKGELVSSALRGLGHAGFRGVNVTTPHKFDAARAADRLEGAAATVGAVNTIEYRGAEMIGHNTDGLGLVRFLERDLGLTLRGTSVLLLGGGGAASAAIAALADAEVRSITVALRDPTSFAPLNLSSGVDLRAITLGDAGEVAGESGLIINATPVGERTQDDPLLGAASIRKGAAVIDMIYRPPATKLLEEARLAGALAHNGLGMLLHQAALSFEIWTGVRPPLEKMSAMALRELAL